MGADIDRFDDWPRERDVEKIKERVCYAGSRVGDDELIDDVNQYLHDRCQRIAEIEAALAMVLKICEGDEFEDAEGMDEIGRIVRDALGKNEESQN